MSKIAMAETSENAKWRMRPPEGKASVKPFCAFRPVCNIHLAHAELSVQYFLKGNGMNLFKTALRVLIYSLLVLPAALLAQTNCEEGTVPLNTAQPKNMTPQEIIEKFGAKEEVF